MLHVGFKCKIIVGIRLYCYKTSLEVCALGLASMSFWNVSPISAFADQNLPYAKNAWQMKNELKIMLSSTKTKQ